MYLSKVGHSNVVKSREGVALAVAVPEALIIHSLHNGYLMGHTEIDVKQTYSSALRHWHAKLYLSYLIEAVMVHYYHAYKYQSSRLTGERI